MSVSDDPNVAITSCAAQQANQPISDPQQLISSQSAGLSNSIEALGIGACTNVTAGGGSLFPPFGVVGQYSTGCEQIALLASEMDAAQKVLQCALFDLSQIKKTTAVQSCTITTNLTQNTLTNCSFVVEQKSGINVVDFTSMTSEIKQQINSNITTAMEGIINSIQKQTETGLFPKSDGEKVVQQMRKNLDTMIANESITQIVQEQISSYTNTGNITVNLTGNTIVGNTNVGNPLVPCVKITQGYVMQVLTQTIMQSSLEQVLTGTAKADLRDLLTNAQEQQLTGFTPPDFGMLAIVGAIAVVAAVLLFSKKNDSNGNKESVLTGKVGTIFGSILLVLGVVLFLVGLVLKLRKKTNNILCYIMMIGGAILMIIAIVMIVKARSQQLRFEQNLQVAKASAKSGQSQ